MGSWVCSFSASLARSWPDALLIRIQWLFNIVQMRILVGNCIHRPTGVSGQGGAHFRDFDLLHCTFVGGADYRFNGHAFSVQPGTILLLPRGIDTHAWLVRHSDGWRVGWLRLVLESGDEELFAYPAHASGARLLAAPDVLLRRLDPIFVRLSELQQVENAQHDILRQCLVRAVLHEIRLFFGPARSPHDPAVARALALMERHLGNSELRLQDLVQAAGCSRTAFVQRFIANLGQPPMRYVEAQRLRLAAHRLRHENDTITSIARDVGFSSSQYFTTRFRQYFGCTPLQHRGSD